MMKLSIRTMAATFAIVGAGMMANPSNAASVIYGLDDSTNSLVRIDGTTGVRTIVGATGVATGEFGDLAYDANTNTAYWVAGRGNSNLYRLNLTTGAATVIGAHGLNDAFGLAFDTSNNRLYASSTSGGTIYTLSTLTGAATLVGNSGFFASGLDYNASNGLVGFAGGSGQLYRINQTTGAGTQIAAGADFINDGDLAYDASSGSYYVVDYSGSVYKYNGGFTSRSLLSTGTPLSGVIVVDDRATGAVPEPATWMMMLIGFGAVGYTLRSAKRRGKATLAA